MTAIAEKPKTRKTKKSAGDPVRRRGVTAPGELTIAKLAEGLDVSTVTVSAYVKRGCPKTSVEDAIKWRQENIRSASEAVDVSDLGREIKRAELARTTEQARERQLKNDILSGKLIPREDVERDLSVALGRVRNRVMGQGLLCANVVPAEFKAVVKSAIDEQSRILLKELAEVLG